MGLQYFFPVHKAALTMQKNKLLPFKTDVNGHPVTCLTCNYVNNPTNNFCTNCGYPQQPGEARLAIYNNRITQRNNLRENCRKKIHHARNSLYVMAVSCLVGISYFINGKKNETLVALILFVLAAMYTSLGRWSSKKPFTSLLISLLLMLTFMAINAWMELASSFHSATGFYIFVIQVVLTYFLVQGVKAAFHADILEEECKV